MFELVWLSYNCKYLTFGQYSQWWSSQLVNAQSEMYNRCSSQPKKHQLRVLNCWYIERLAGYGGGGGVSIVSLHCYRLNKPTFYRRLHRSDTDRDLLKLLLTSVSSVSGDLTGAEKCINDNVRDERNIISYLHAIVYCGITSRDVFPEKIRHRLDNNLIRPGLLLIAKQPQLQQTHPSGTIEIPLCSRQWKFVNYSVQ